jgi:hypothetical protein
MTMVSKIGGASLAQSLLARVESRKAQETAEVAIPASSADETSPSAASTRSVQTEATARVGAQLDASRLQPEGAAAGQTSAATDYIAEADTNNDRKVSEQERIAYAKKQASEAEKAASQPDAPAERSRAQEVQQAYLPQESTGAQLDIEA